jgi:hypothetical protein
MRKSSKDTAIAKGKLSEPYSIIIPSLSKDPRKMIRVDFD